MKRLVLMIVPALICGIVFIGCGSTKSEENVDELQSEETVDVLDEDETVDKFDEDETFGMLQYVKTELGGCNTKSALSSDNDETETNDDEIIVSTSEEFVNVFVGLNYICKSEPFETKSEIIDDVLCMYIVDTCILGSDCYMRCHCYYTFDFVFEREKSKTINQKYRIVLIDPREENHIVISEGVLVEKE